MATVTLHSTLALERETGVNRTELKGIISGLKLKTYRGPRRAVCLDDEGRDGLLTHLRDEERLIAG